MYHPPSKPKRFQFTIRFLLLLPLGVVVIGATGRWFGQEWAFVAGGVCAALLVSWAWYKGNMTKVELLVVLCIIGILVALLVPATQSTSSGGRRMQCRNNLKQIGLALHLYHDAHGCFPPAMVTDETGRPMHGWRTLILPHLELTPLHNLIDPSRPWDAPENQRIASETLWAFTCASKSPRPNWPCETSYVAIVGPNTAWSPEGCRTIDDFSDPMSETILVVEVADSGIDWIEPRDLTLEELVMAINATPDQSISSHHRGGVNVLLADGSVRFLPNSIAEETLRAMLTIDGGETIELEE